MPLAKARAKEKAKKENGHLWSVGAALALDIPRASAHPRPARPRTLALRNVKYVEERVMAGRNAQVREEVSTHPRGARARACMVEPVGTGPTMEATGGREKEKGMAKVVKVRVAKFLGLEKNMMGHGAQVRSHNGQIRGEHPPISNGHRD